MTKINKFEFSDAYTFNGITFADLKYMEQSWLLGANNADWQGELTAIERKIDPDTINILNQNKIWIELVNKPPQLVLMCCGQGSIWPGMGKNLYNTFPKIREAMDYIASMADWDVLSLMDETSVEKITLTRWQQPYLFLLEFAQAYYLQHLGLKPNMICGHSLGELIALCLAGAYSPEIGWEMIDTRAKHMHKLEAEANQETGMLAIYCSSEQLKIILAENKDIYVSNYNSPTQSILSGPRELLLDIRKKLRKQRIPAVMLNVSLAFHHPHMRSLRETALKGLYGADLKAPTTPILSNVTTNLYPSNSRAVAEHIADLDENTVRWVECVEKMWDTYQIRHFVELGPADVLCGLTADIQPQALCIATGRKDKDVEAMQMAIAKLYSLGHLPKKTIIQCYAENIVLKQDTILQTNASIFENNIPSSVQNKYLEGLFSIIMQIIGCSKNELKASTNLRYDLAIRSSQIPELLLKIEEQLNIPVNFEDIININTLEDFALILQNIDTNVKQIKNNLNAEPPKVLFEKNTQKLYEKHIDCLRYTISLNQIPDETLSFVSPMVENLYIIGNCEQKQLDSLDIPRIYPNSQLKHINSLTQAFTFFDSTPLHEASGVIFILNEDNIHEQWSNYAQNIIDYHKIVKIITRSNNLSFCLAMEFADTESILMEAFTELFLNIANAYPECFFRTASIQNTNINLDQLLAKAKDKTENITPLHFIFTAQKIYTKHLKPIAISTNKLRQNKDKLFSAEHAETILILGNNEAIFPSLLENIKHTECTFIFMGNFEILKKDSILYNFSNTKGRIEYIFCDLANNNSTTQNLQNIIEKYQKIDLLLYSFKPQNINTDADSYAVIKTQFNIALNCLELSHKYLIKNLIIFADILSWYGYGQDLQYTGTENAIIGMVKKYCQINNIFCRTIWLSPINIFNDKYAENELGHYEPNNEYHIGIEQIYLAELFTRELFCSTQKDVVWAKLLPKSKYIIAAAAINKATQIGLHENPELFCSTFPHSFELTAMPTFVGGQHISTYKNKWLKDCAKIDYTNAVYQVPSSILIEGLLEAALQNTPWLHLNHLANYKQLKNIDCSQAITRELLIDTHTLPFSPNSYNVLRMCECNLKLLKLTKSGRNTATWTSICQAEVAYSVKPSEPRSLWGEVYMGEKNNSAFIVEDYYAQLKIGKHWQLLESFTKEKNYTKYQRYSGILDYARLHKVHALKDNYYAYPLYLLESCIHTAFFASIGEGDIVPKKLTNIKELRWVAHESIKSPKLFITLSMKTSSSKNITVYDGEVFSEAKKVLLTIQDMIFENI